MRSAGLIVIGAGVLGTFHALFAARRGINTLLIERDAWPNGASVRNFGMLPQTIVDPTGLWAPYAQDTAEIYRSIQDEHDITVTEPGSLYLASTESERTVLGEFAQRFGERYECEYLEAHAVLARYPFVQESYCVAGLVFPHDLSLDPRRMLRQLIPYVEATGRVEYLPGTTILSLERVADRCVLRDSRNMAYEAERVVICSGADYRTLLPDTVLQSEFKICKLQMMSTVSQPDVHLQHNILSGLSIRRYPAFTVCASYDRLLEEPVDEDLVQYGIHLLLKQGAGGEIIIGDSHEYRDAAEVPDLEERTDCAINDAILRYARQMLDLPSWQIQSQWNGYYMVHPTEPIHCVDVDERVRVVTGIAGKGMTTGPGFARYSVETMFA